VLSSWRNREGGVVERGLLAVAAVLVINAAVLVIAVGVVTVPLGLSAGSEALYRWRHYREEFIVAAFVRSLRHDVGRRLAVGWAALAAVGWGVLVIIEGADLVRPWRLVVPALGLSELAVAVPFSWLALSLGWAADGSVGSILRTALILSVRMPSVMVSLDVLTLGSAVIIAADPLLVVVGLVAVTGLIGQWSVDRGLARQGIVLWRRSSGSDDGPGLDG